MEYKHIYLWLNYIDMEYIAERLMRGVITGEVYWGGDAVMV